MSWEDIIKANEVGDPAFDERNKKTLHEISVKLQDIREELSNLGSDDLSEYKEHLFDAREKVGHADNRVTGILDELVDGSTELAETLARRPSRFGPKVYKVE